jgi:hypothetical protein
MAATQGKPEDVPQPLACVMRVRELAAVSLLLEVGVVSGRNDSKLKTH